MFVIKLVLLLATLPQGLSHLQEQIHRTQELTLTLRVNIVTILFGAFHPAALKENFMLEFNRFPELSRTSSHFQHFPVLENATDNKIPGL